MEKIISAVEQYFPYAQSLRRDFHMHPELGFQEFRTAGIVARELTELGYEIKTGVAKTGVVALLEGEKPGPTLMLRFDMDALPLQEHTEAPYASQNPGIMHACGHDAHTAIGLTVARILKDYQTRLHGNVKLVFQPAEEGLGGAKAMLEEGVLNDPRPDQAMALHVWNEKPYGWLGITPGPVMSASDVFQIRIIGRGGHGGIPHLSVDPVLASAQVVNALQSIVSRNVDPLQSVVISVTMIHAGDANNIIPSDVDLRGTIRTIDPEVRKFVLQRFNDIVSNVAQAMGCQVEIEIETITPAVVNHAKVAERVQSIASQLLPDATVDTNHRTMVSEDMALFLQEIPGCFVFVGSANHEKGLNYAHHHPRFDIDEGALKHGIALISAAALDFLQ
jgi:amidohydrolase